MKPSEKYWYCEDIQTLSDYKRRDMDHIWPPFNTVIQNVLILQVLIYYPNAFHIASLNSETILAYDEHYQHIQLDAKFSEVIKKMAGIFDLKKLSPFNINITRDNIERSRNDPEQSAMYLQTLSLAESLCLRSSSELSSGFNHATAKIAL